MARVPVAISACLVGERVRYDGGHKLAAFAGELSAELDWIPVCPEVGAGMATPRPPLVIAGTRDAPRMLTRGSGGGGGGGSGSGGDWTDAMAAFAAREIERLRALNICGFALKSKSPSCGLRGIEVSGLGLFARALVGAMPELPVADDVELGDPSRRRAFVAAVLALARSRGILPPCPP